MNGSLGPFIVLYDRLLPPTMNDAYLPGHALVRMIERSEVGSAMSMVLIKGRFERIICRRSSEFLAVCRRASNQDLIFICCLFLLAPDSPCYKP